MSYSNEGLEGSVLTYHCKAGHYAFPATQRVCDRDGEWSAMRLPNGQRKPNAVCKGIFSYTSKSVFKYDPCWQNESECAQANFELYRQKNNN